MPVLSTSAALSSSQEESTPKALVSTARLVISGISHHYNKADTGMAAVFTTIMRGPR